MTRKRPQAKRSKAYDVFKSSLGVYVFSRCTLLCRGQSNFKPEKISDFEITIKKSLTVVQACLMESIDEKY
jgi:hypothetical protein